MSSENNNNSAVDNNNAVSSSDAAKRRHQAASLIAPANPARTGNATRVAHNIVRDRDKDRALTLNRSLLCRRRQPLLLRSSLHPLFSLPVACSNNIEIKRHVKQDD